MRELLYIPVIFGVSLEVYFILVILGTPSFFFWRWLFKKFIKADRKRIIITWLTTIFATPLIYVGICFLVIYAVTYYPNRDFDKQRWNTFKEKRYELSKDIIKSKILIGKSKTEVIKLLGTGQNLEGDDTWYYDLGVRPGLFNIDEAMLNIYFKNGKVEDVSKSH